MEEPALRPLVIHFIYVRSSIKLLCKAFAEGKGPLILTFFLLTLAAFLLQATVRGRPALAITSREFCGVMKGVKEGAVSGQHKLHPRMSSGTVEDSINYSFDHFAVHECSAKLHEIAGIAPSHRSPLPPNSPDFQHPVEHAHGRFKQAFLKAITKHPHLRSKERVQSFARELWFQVNPPEVVNKDVQRLEGLYSCVRDVSLGGYAPKKLS